MSSQVRPTSPKSVNWRSLQTRQDRSTGLKIAERETFISCIDESRHDSGSHVELLDRQNFTDCQTGNPMTEGDPRTYIRRVSRGSLMDQYLDLGCGNVNEEIAIDHCQLRG